MINEPLPISKDFPVKARLFNYKYFTYPWHFHPQYEFIYIKKGKGSLFVGTSIKRFEEGDIIILGPNLPHYLKSDSEYYFDEKKLEVKGTIIQLEMDFMHYSITNYPHLIKIKNVFEISAYGIHIKNSNKKLVDLLDTIPEQQGLVQLISILMLFKELTELELEPIIKTSKTNNKYKGSASRIEKVLSYIDENYTKNITLDKIAFISNMNPAAFCRFFKIKTGKSFKRYISEIRITHACKLLALSDFQILQISTDCGFDTIAHFNRTFKKYVGYTPTAYKAIILKKNNIF